MFFAKKRRRKLFIPQFPSKLSSRAIRSSSINFSPNTFSSFHFTKYYQSFFIFPQSIIPERYISHILYILFFFMRDEVQFLQSMGERSYFASFCNFKKNISMINSTNPSSNLFGLKRL